MGDERRIQFIEAAARVLRDRGPAELTVRRVAEAAGESTMGVYTGFGSRAGVLDALYLHGFELLHARLDGLPRAATPIDAVVAVALGYRDFALAEPHLYGFLFERPLPDFEPAVASRAAALESTFGYLLRPIGELTPNPERPAYQAWAAMHGLVSIELTHQARDPLPGWFLETPDQWREIYLDGVRASLTGLGLLR
ncbi:TetR/AcrR family transcriptional regulator [Actinokineospora sp. NBRC 105648]|uniref:TetR/AcrR family transcriptional regulator n=1 Tax=Actinokineospora sp. NBRC 105648 TaxID=3032206 RepID=UPI0024A405E7|nr:TetR/AcrR family transcriptional regulator [Actinokineospora sp. NBRC 105648]GLZ40058.1 TetR family transcriptional regulator [Actinokineospora sp. NBRC 105648]